MKTEAPTIFWGGDGVIGDVTREHFGPNDRGMLPKMPPQLFIPAEISVALAAAAVQAVRATASSIAPRRRSRRGQALRPGVDTPLWNALVSAVHAQLKVRGDRAKLGRVLGLPRQRVTEMLRTRRHLPDAERALILLTWLHARQHGRDLG